MAAEREQLQHMAIKVRGDLHEMRAKQQDTASTVNTLLSDLSTLLSTQEGTGSEQQQQDLSATKVAQLKKLAQLGSVQVEKADAQLKAKVAALEKYKQELQQKIR